MKIKGIIAEDFINYKIPSMVIEFPYCDLKCDKECGYSVCQNSEILKAPVYDVPIQNIVKFYLGNDITKALCLQGMEPCDSKDEMFRLIQAFRTFSDDDIIIYTGYNKEEIPDVIKFVKHYKNIIIKFGRYIPNQTKHYDKILGVTLASSNQYAEKIC